MTPDELRARVLYRDSSVLILDKPAGLAVHPGPRTPDSLERHLGALSFGLRQPPALAHRLDRDTSGCLVLARHRRTLSRLGRLFAAGQVAKTYWAVVWGRPPADEGQVDAALRKVVRKDGWRMEPDPAGSPAVTGYRLLQSAGPLSLVEFRPHTGRTHQIRVHGLVLGCPVVGDPVYGPAPDPGVVLHLHSRAVSLPLKRDQPPVTATAPLPPHMRATLRAHGFDRAWGEA